MPSSKRHTAQRLITQSEQHIDKALSNLAAALEIYVDGYPTISYPIAVVIESLEVIKTIYEQNPVVAFDMLKAHMELLKTLTSDIKRMI